MIVPLWNIENEQGKTSDDFLSSAQDGREAGFEQKVAKIVPYGPPIVSNSFENQRIRSSVPIRGSFSAWQTAWQAVRVGEP